LGIGWIAAERCHSLFGAASYLQSYLNVLKALTYQIGGNLDLFAVGQRIFWDHSYFKALAVAFDRLASRKRLFEGLFGCRS
jgi:hypothetical protein